MGRKRETRRAVLRNRSMFPVGMFAALLTGAFVTLLGAFLMLEPFVILIRAFISAIVIGSICSLGVSIVRLADSEHKKRTNDR